MFVHLEGKDLGCSASAGDSNGEQADWSATGDRDALRRDVASQNGMYRVAQRIENDGILLAESTGSSFQMLDSGMTTYSANAPFASTPMILTCWQMCASPMRHCRHLPQATCISAETKSPSLTLVTSLPTDSTVAAKLVSGNERRMDAALRPLVPLVDVQVGAADGGHLDLHQNVGRVQTSVWGLRGSPCPARAPA